MSEREERLLALLEQQAASNAALAAQIASQSAQLAAQQEIQSKLLAAVDTLLHTSHPPTQVQAQVRSTYNPAPGQAFTMQGLGCTQAKSPESSIVQSSRSPPGHSLINSSVHACAGKAAHQAYSPSMADDPFAWLEGGLEHLDDIDRELNSTAFGRGSSVDLDSSGLLPMDIQHIPTSAHYGPAAVSKVSPGKLRPQSPLTVGHGGGSARGTQPQAQAQAQPVFSSEVDRVKSLFSRHQRRAAGTER
jgi:hypothetical protein